MNDRQNVDAAGCHFVNDPIAVQEALAYRCVTELGNDTTCQRMNFNYLAKGEQCFYNALSVML